MRTILTSLTALAAATVLALAGSGIALANTHDDHSSADRHDRTSDSSSHDRHNDHGCAGEDSSNVLSCTKLIPINIG